MAASTANEIYGDITDHISKQGGPASSWYAGISQDPEQRMFGDHKVSKQGSWWIYRKATSSMAARNVEKALIDLGCDGGSGGGDNSAVHVYAYLKSTQTQP